MHRKDGPFCHKGRLSPVITSKNKELHDKCKNDICEYLMTIFPEENWKTERPIPAKESKGWEKEIIPDISGRFGNKQNFPIAIEIQKSAYTLNKIYDKTIEYAKRKIYVIWMVPLSKELAHSIKKYNQKMNCMN